MYKTEKDQSQYYPLSRTRNTISYILIRHRVRDYAKWTPVLNEHGATLKAKGAKEGHLVHNANDPNEFVLLLEWDNREKARQFVLSEDLRKAMERSGVSDQPGVYFLDKRKRGSV